MDASTARTRPRALARIGTFAAALLAAGAVLGAPVAAAAVPLRVNYRNIPVPLPGDLPSVGFEATSTSEFGGQVQFAGAARENPKVQVAMSSRACQIGHWDTGDCVTAPGQTFTHVVTLNIYAVNADGSPGSVLASGSKSATIPYRPSADPLNCTGADAGRWFSSADSACFDGQASRINFPRQRIVLPKKAIVSISFDTTHAGYSPIGETSTCFGVLGGCGYDYLGVALNSPPTKGTDPLPDDAYVNASLGGSYCDGGTGGIGTFRLDAGCWTGKQLAIRVRALAP